VGVDVERLRPVPSAAAIVSRFFSDRERSAFLRIAPEDRAAAFLRAWTRKEACVKARGADLSLGLDRIPVFFLAPTAPRRLSLPGDTPSSPPWTLRDLDVGRGYAGALAVEGGRVRVRCWGWRG
jgi:4'-phosphopantetheinyl transferase